MSYYGAEPSVLQHGLFIERGDKKQNERDGEKKKKRGEDRWREKMRREMEKRGKR